MRPYQRVLRVRQKGAILLEAIVASALIFIILTGLVRAIAQVRSSNHDNRAYVIAANYVHRIISTAQMLSRQTALPRVGHYKNTDINTRKFRNYPDPKAVNEFSLHNNESGYCNISTGTYPPPNTDRQRALRTWLEQILFEQELPGIAFNRIAIYSNWSGALNVSICWTGRGFNQIQRYTMVAFLPNIESKIFTYY